MLHSHHHSPNTHSHHEHSHCHCETSSHHHHESSHSCCCTHSHHKHEETETNPWWFAVSATMLVIGIILDALSFVWFLPIIRFSWYILAFLPVGLGVLREAWESVLSKDFFSEFMLMSLASIGAFAIGEYPEAVAVMLLYCIGEMLQDKAVDKARHNIENLLKVKPSTAHRVTNVSCFKDNSLNTPALVEDIAPSLVTVGDILEIKPGERVPLDGTLISIPHSEKSNSSCEIDFNTAALTGESIPRTLRVGSEVLSGMIATSHTAYIRVCRLEHESALSRILQMVEEAAEHKAPTELFIRKFARIYTPLVILFALLTLFVPWLWSILDVSFSYHFSLWLRRALIFLVISCPCALVISIPLSYFAGIGASSKRGILFKGSNYLDAMTELRAVVFDKTGTLTTGVFSIKEVEGLSSEEMNTIVQIERSSNHPIARAIVANYADNGSIHAEEISAGGMLASIGAEEWLVGNTRLMKNHGVKVPSKLSDIPHTIVVCARNNKYIGHIILADSVKEDAPHAISTLKNLGIERVEMLSGDKQALVNDVASTIGIENAKGELLPQDKASELLSIQKSGQRVAFVGDGINDAPVLALADVGIAMGALGADMAVETANVIIQTDQPSKVTEAIAIAKHTRNIVRQNIILAIGIKLAVMLLGVLGVANLWEAVFADTGVALLAVLNAMRIFRH